MLHAPRVHVKIFKKEKKTTGKTKFNEMSRASTQAVNLHSLSLPCGVYSQTFGEYFGITDCTTQALWTYPPRSQGPFFTTRNYFLEVEKGPWEQGWEKFSSDVLADTSNAAVKIRANFVCSCVAYHNMDTAGYFLL